MVIWSGEAVSEVEDASVDASESTFLRGSWVFEGGGSLYCDEVGCIRVQSVIQVFDALEFYFKYFMNMEIATTELGDDLAMREVSNNLESGSKNLSSGPIVEKNALKLFEYFNEDGHHGRITSR
ncbi:hypothetical protein PR003_g27765 [Phytophthora rubi]|uniref:Uncharacterized protein n=1 Tax=Phytophthora rubi TaxID=129364 RepID=A0A6A4BVJ9_9STRA|nr:hypothetical protein PR002_g27212 [Phytophthora rubi]KAE8972686.1 hypothetical protein PR001_g26531 [Phytophthora rubi]KAE9281106.1 hypothetical protein PR003_g27765 [Phytophthora rubi]